MSAAACGLDMAWWARTTPDIDWSKSNTKEEPDGIPFSACLDGFIPACQTLKNPGWFNDGLHLELS